MKWQWKEHVLEHDTCVSCRTYFPQAEGRTVIYTNVLGWIYRGHWTGMKESCCEYHG